MRVSRMGCAEAYHLVVVVVTGAATFGVGLEPQPRSSSTMRIANPISAAHAAVLFSTLRGGGPGL